MTTPGQDAVTQALQRVLAAQHAAVYGYPVIGVTLRSAGQIRLARQLEAGHRSTRDALMAQLAARRATPEPAEASYRPVLPVAAPADAQRWALDLEEGCAEAYRYLLAASAAPTGPGASPSASGASPTASGAAAPSAAEQAGMRRQALAGLTTAALTATQWRALLSPGTPTTPFPGL